MVLKLFKYLLIVITEYIFNKFLYISYISGNKFIVYMTVIFFRLFVPYLVYS